jgi:hypothetical protein
MKPVFDRFLARLFHGPSPFLVRGGYAIELLWAPKRTSHDLDLLFRGQEKNESPGIAIWRHLKKAAETDLKDGFTYRFITEPRVTDSIGGLIFVIWVTCIEMGKSYKIDIGTDFIPAPSSHLTIVPEEVLFAGKLLFYCWRKQRKDETKAVQDYVDLCFMAEKHKFGKNLNDVILKKLAWARHFQVNDPSTLLKAYPPDSMWEKSYQRLANQMEIKTSFNESLTLLTSLLD